MPISSPLFPDPKDELGPLKKKPTEADQMTRCLDESLVRVVGQGGDRKNEERSIRVSAVVKWSIW